MLTIGCHLSAAKGYEAMARDALNIGANTFQFFTRNPRGGKAKDMNPADIDAFLKIFQEHHFQPILAHAPYTLNPASGDPRIREFAFMVMADDLKRLAYTPHSLYNLHPGSHVGNGVTVGIQRIAELLNTLIPQAGTTRILLEAMSGKGSEIGGRFEELRDIINALTYSDNIGVCIDTCHIFAAGYDIKHHLDDVLDEFDAVVGLNRLKAIHLNDSLTPFASHTDRHAAIGQGTIGADALVRVVNHPRLAHIPFYLETPNDLDGWAQEIAFFKSQYRRS